MLTMCYNKLEAIKAVLIKYNHKNILSALINIHGVRKKEKSLTASLKFHRWLLSMTKIMQIGEFLGRGEQNAQLKILITY